MAALTDLRRLFTHCLLALLASFVLATNAAVANSLVYAGSERSAVQEGFAFPAGKQPKITIMRPEIFVGEQSSGGLARVNADWTKAGKENLLFELQQRLQKAGFSTSVMPELSGENETITAEYRALFKIVVNSAIENDLWPADGLPTKKGEFDWSLGPGIAKLSEIGAGEFALFFYSHDSFPLPGRRALELVGIAKGFDAPEQPSVGYAGLVDLRNGKLVWLNVNLRIDGDVRKPEGARERARQLLNDFPGIN